MASFNEHCRDCERLLGDRCENVNRWMDEMHSKHGLMHRFVRHHWRGVKEAEKLFGSVGRNAAIIHILKDCGRIPEAHEWKAVRTDTLGINTNKTMSGNWETQRFDIEAKRLIGL